jgi:capsular exopolysaccharide synthesis family protein
MAEMLPTLPSRSGDGSSEQPLNRVVRVVRERLWWFLLTAILTMVVVFVVVKRQTPIFRATAIVMVDTNAPRVLSPDLEVAPLGSSGFGQQRGFYQAQRQILQSRDLAAIVVNRLGLSRDERFLSLNRRDKPLTRAQKDAVMATADVVGMMAGRVVVEAADDSGVLRVSIEDADADMARDLANAVVKAYRDRNIDVKKRVVKEATSDLNAIFKRLEGDKDTSLMALYSFEKDHDFSEARRTMVNEQILALSRSLREVHMLRLRAQQEMNQLRKFKGTRDIFMASAPGLMRDGLVGELKRRYLDLSVRRKELATSYLPDHPKLQAVDQQMEQLITLATRHVAALADSATTQYQNASAEETDLERQLEAGRAQDAEIRLAKIEHDKLQVRLDEDKMFYDKVAKRITEADITRDIGVNNVNVLDLAVTPKAPVRPNVQSGLALGGVLALLLGLGAAFLVDLLDNRIRTREDVEQVLGVPYLGAIPMFEPGDPGEGIPVPEDRLDLYVHFRPNSRAAEAARSVRTNLLFMRPDKPIRSLLVTSASAREGKTSTSTTLAVTLAATSGNALLIDTDLRKPRLHRLFGLAGGEGGLTSYLVSHRPIEDFVVHTEVPGLDFLPCGPVPPNPSELLHAQRFKTLVEEVNAKYDFVVFDSSPGTLVTDPLVLASMVDGVVVVAHSQGARRDQLKSFLAGLRAVNASILGVVQSRVAQNAGGYGYYYAKGYRRGGYRYQYRYQRDPNKADDVGDEPPGSNS